MLRCTYIVLIHDHANNILNLVKSLKAIEGDFRKEFIFIDDGSTDDSLNILKQAVNDLPKTTIITQAHQGPSVSINKALSLATGDYTHFACGDEVLHPNSTSILLESCRNLGAQVAVGLFSSVAFTGDIKINASLIENPTKNILLGKIPALRMIGKSVSLVDNQLLQNVGKIDSNIYTQNMSLSLRCSKYSKFVYVANSLSTVIKSNDDKNDKFETYNNLKAIYNFAKENPEFASKLGSVASVNVARVELVKVRF